MDVVPEGGFDAALADHLEIELTAVTPQGSDIEIDVLTPEEPKVESVYARDNSAAPEMAIPVGGALTYVPFDIYLPAEKRVEMEARRSVIHGEMKHFEHSNYLQVSLLLPTKDNIALFHAADIRFGNSTGKNVLCTSPQVDLKSVYPTTFQQTANLSTFMQVTPQILTALKDVTRFFCLSDGLCDL